MIKCTIITNRDHIYTKIKKISTLATLTPAQARKRTRTNSYPYLDYYLNSSP